VTPQRLRLLSEWRELINVTPTELEGFLANYGIVAGLSRSEAASQGIRSGRDSARAILRMQAKPVERWSTRDWDWAQRQVSFIKRMRGNVGPLWADDGPSRKLLSLILWGHDPARHEGHGALVAVLLRKKPTKT